MKRYQNSYLEQKTFHYTLILESGVSFLQAKCMPRSIVTCFKSLYDLVKSLKFRVCQIGLPSLILQHFFIIRGAKSYVKNAKTNALEVSPLPSCFVKFALPFKCLAIEGMAII